MRWLLEHAQMRHVLMFMHVARALVSLELACLIEKAGELVEELVASVWTK